MAQASRRAVKASQSVVSQSLMREDETVASLYKSGDEVMAGIDSATPGQQIPLHLCLRAEVKYGLKPWEALQTATILPARHTKSGRS